MILIVDDAPENIISLKKVLEVNGFEVDTASSGEEALKKILKNSYVLIILDVQMPEMDGYETTQKIRREHKNSSLPIIAVTAKAMKGDRDKYWLSCHNRFLPLSVSLLVFLPD